MASNGTPQGVMYGMRQASNNAYRDRSAEQQNSTSGNPNMPLFNYNQGPGYGDLYNQYYYGGYNTPTGGQRQELNRYIPPMMNGTGNSGWQQSGPYSYNIPNSFGPYVGAYGSGQPANTQAGYMSGGNPYAMPMFNGNYGMYGQGASSPFAGYGTPYGANQQGGYGNQIQQMMQYLQQYQGGGGGGMNQSGYNPGVNAQLPYFNQSQQAQPNMNSMNMSGYSKGTPQSMNGVQSSYPSNPQQSGGFQAPSTSGSNYAMDPMQWNRLSMMLGMGY